PGELAQDAVEAAVSDVARVGVFALSEAWLAGDAPRALRVLAALRDAGEALTLVVWQLAEVRAAMAGGTPAAVAIRQARVWGRRQAAMDSAARRVSRDTLRALVAR